MGINPGQEYDAPTEHQQKEILSSSFSLLSEKINKTLDILSAEKATIADLSVTGFGISGSQNSVQTPARK